VSTVRNEHAAPIAILSIEDDPKDAKLIQDLLETEGVACEVTRVDTQAALVASSSKAELIWILADYTLPRSTAFPH